MHWIEREKVIAVVRLDDLESAVALTEAMLAGGVTTVEFTYTNRQAGGAIERVREALGDRCLVGAGTVLDPETARGHSGRSSVSRDPHSESQNYRDGATLWRHDSDWSVYPD
jgi:2-keto-3-deoxy-6-phosphogluconate aldolase